MDYADKSKLSPIIMVLILFLVLGLVGVGALFFAMVSTMIG